MTPTTFGHLLWIAISCCKFIALSNILFSPDFVLVYKIFHEQVEGAGKREAAKVLMDPTARDFYSCYIDLNHSTESSMQDDPKSDPSSPTRRAFLRSTGSTAAAAIIGVSGPTHLNISSVESTSAAETVDGPNIDGAVPITLRINGKDRRQN